MPAVTGLDIRAIRADEVDTVLDMLAAWQSRAFFERYFHRAPAFRPEHVYAAFDGGRPVSCAQIVPKTIHVVGGTATVGGIGQVWTESAYRRRGIAPLVLRGCVDALRRERFALSLLFASRLAFYGSLGWHQYPRRRTALVGWPEAASAVTVRPFDERRDFDAVRALYATYTRHIPGVTVRDETAWRASLATAGYPSETFLVAVDGADTVRAYARGSIDEGVYIALDFAYAAEEHAALAAVLTAHGVRAQPEPGFVLLDLAHDTALGAYLSAAGFQLNPVEDPFVMWRVIDRTALPDPGAPIQSAADEIACLRRHLPPERYTYWHADRF